VTAGGDPGTAWVFDPTRLGMKEVRCSGRGGETCTVRLGIQPDATEGRCAKHLPPKPVPEPAVYPPSSHPPAAIRVADPNVAAYCPHPNEFVNLNLMSLDPDDIRLVYQLHDQLHHRADGWLIGGPGGGVGDVCNPCAGWNTKEKKPLTDGPRHDLCLNGRTTYRGGDCPCTHDKPHMRGIKPGQEVHQEAWKKKRAEMHATLEEQQRANAERLKAANRAEIMFLIDPEADTDD
jgi:hypothetical protein